MDATQANYYDKKSAHNLVAKAIAAGELVPQRCSVCNRRDALAHHDDYTRPLDVRWLCPMHHGAYHSVLNSQEQPWNGDLRSCRWCNGPLRPRQKQFCQSSHRAAVWDRLHPRIRPVGLGLQNEGSIQRRLARLLVDGQKRTHAQMAFELRVSGATAARELRKARRRGLPVKMARPYGSAAPAVFWIERGAR